MRKWILFYKCTLYNVHACIFLYCVAAGGVHTYVNKRQTQSIKYNVRHLSNVIMFLIMFLMLYWSLLWYSDLYQITYPSFFFRNKLFVMGAVTFFLAKLPQGIFIKQLIELLFFGGLRYFWSFETFPVHFLSERCSYNRTNLTILVCFFKPFVCEHERDLLPKKNPHQMVKMREKTKFIHATNRNDSIYRSKYE